MINTCESTVQVTEAATTLQTNQKQVSSSPFLLKNRSMIDNVNHCFFVFLFIRMEKFNRSESQQ